MILIIYYANKACFICSIPAVEFQRHAKKGFEDHVKNDHNIWLVSLHSILFQQKDIFFFY